MKILFTLAFLAGSLCEGQVCVHGGLGQTGWNQNESNLTPASVAHSFGKLGAYSVTGFMLSQPCYVSGVTIGGAVVNAVIAETMACNLYAFNADVPGSAALWSTSLCTPWSSPPTQLGLLGQSLGCISTPAIDSTNGWVFAVCATNTPSWKLYKVNLSDGSVASSVTISGQVTGTGCTSGTDYTSGANLVFHAQIELQRPGLSIANGNVYFAFAGWGDSTTCWHGWVFGYAESDLSQAAIFCANPNSGGSMTGTGTGIWMSGGALSVDGSGNLYAITGDGTYNGTTEFGDTLLKLSSTLTVSDWFTPSNNATLLSVDADLSSARPVLIPGGNQVVIAGKDFNVYVLDTTCLGHLQGSSMCSIQNFKTDSVTTPDGGTGSYGILFMNNSLFLPLVSGELYSFGSWSGSTFNSTPVRIRSATSGAPGPAELSGSSNAAASGVVWVVTSATTASEAVAAGTLRALNPANLLEYWNSDTLAQDSLGNRSKFVAPVIANGRVYVATQSNALVVYGPSGGSVLKGMVIK